MNSTTL